MLTAQSFLVHLMSMWMLLWSPQYIPSSYTHVTSGGSAPTLVQDTYGGQVGTFSCFNSTTCSSVSINVTAGDALFVVAAETAGNAGSGGTISGVTDTCGTGGGGSDTYTTGPTANTNKGKAFYTIIGATKACVVTATNSSASSWMVLYIQEITGVNGTTPVVTNQWAGSLQAVPGVGTDAITSGALSSATTQTNTYLACVNIDAGGSADTWTIGTGFTHASTRTDSNSSIFGQWIDLASSGSTQACTATTTAGAANTYYSFAMAFQHP